MKQEQVNLLTFLKTNSIFLIIFWIIFSINSNSYSAEKNSTKLRVTIPYFTVLDDFNNSSELSVEIAEKLKNKVKNSSLYTLVNISDKYKDYNLLTSNEILSIGRENTVDIIITGSIFKMGNDLGINIRLNETISGKTIFSKQYFINKNDLDKLVSNIFESFEGSISQLVEFYLNIINVNQGNSEIRVKTIPRNGIIAFNGNEVGRAPLILKNVSEAQNILESWQEEEAIVKLLRVKSEDGQAFGLKVNGKLYTNSEIKLENLKDREINFEIISKPDSTPSTNERAKISNLKYENREFIIEVITDPGNLQVDLNGKNVGSTPLNLENYKQKKYVLKVNRKKLLIFRKVVNSFENKIANVEFNLLKLGRSLVSSKPENAEIFVDDSKIGTTPKSIDMTPGKHTITLKKDGYKTESYRVTIEEGKTFELNADLTSLKSSDTIVAFVPTGIADNSLSVSGLFMSLGQFSINEDTKSWAYFYGTEINYGINDFFKIGKYINFSVQGAAFYNKLSLFTPIKNFSSNQGVGAKLQFLKQGEVVPISAALGMYYNFNPDLVSNFISYLAISRDFNKFSFHLGIQGGVNNGYKLQAINLNLNYNIFYRVKLGAIALIDFNMFAPTESEYLSPLFGINLGYNFF